MQLKFLDPGQLRTQLTLEQPVETPDGQGGFTLTWTTLATLWALVEPLGGRARSLPSEPTVFRRTGSGCGFETM